MRGPYLIMLLCFAYYVSSGQQSLDVFTISGRIGTPRPYQEIYTGKATESAALVNLKIPIPLSENTLWFSDVTYIFSNVASSEPLPSGIADPIRLNGFIIQTGIVQALKNDQAFQLLVVPRFMSDLETKSSKNWQIGAVGLYEKRYSEQLMLRYGMLYNQELFGPILVPLFYVDWYLSEKWYINGMLPIFVKINYQANPNLILGFSHFGLTTTYRLGNPSYQGDYIERTSIDLSLFARQRIAGNVHAEIRIGHTLNRRYAQYAEDDKIDLRFIIFNIGDNRTQLNEDFKNGFIGNLRLVYNFQPKDE
jgi:hypothetical protein